MYVDVYNNIPAVGPHQDICNNTINTYINQDLTLFASMQKQYIELEIL